jgi:Flp pilus assembly pilin Flp
MHTILTGARAIATTAVTKARVAGRWLRRTAPQVGQSMVEYAIIAAIVAVVAVAAVKVLGTSVNNAFTRAEVSIDEAGKP